MGNYDANAKGKGRLLVDLSELKPRDPYPINTSLDHLPAEKQAQVRHAMEAILENTPKEAIEMIILFGSYSTGKWVNHVYQDKRGTTHEYTSDIDIIVVTHTSQQAQPAQLKEARCASLYCKKGDLAGIS